MKEPRIILGAWELKKKGFPQPEIQDGQVWVNLFDHVHRIKATPFGFVTEQISEASGEVFRPFDGVASEGMAYCPTKLELEHFLNDKANGQL